MSISNPDSSQYQTRIWIGPPYRPADDARHFDWTAIADDPTGYFDDPPAATLAAAMDSDDVALSYTLTSGTVPASGGVWIRPDVGSGQGWEFVEYESNAAGTLSGLHRQAQSEREHDGSHDAGADLFWFYPLTDDSGGLAPSASGEIHLTQRLEYQAAILDWSAQISGYHLPRHAIRNHHLVAVERRKYSDSNGPGSWEVWFVGWLRQPTGQDDGSRNATWSAEVVSISQMANRYEVAGVDVGPRDIAKDGSASSSTVLSFAYKERASGDFTEADPSFDAGNVLDRAAPLWISDQYVGTRNYEADSSEYHRNNGNHVVTECVFSVIYLQRPLGLPSRGYRFIELTVVPDPGDETSLKDYRLKVESSGINHLLDIGEYDVAEGNKIILCEDQQLWQEENPLNGAEQIHEIPMSVFDGISVNGDTLVLQRENTPFTFSHGVSWGLTGEMLPNWPVEQEEGDKWVWQGSTQIGTIPAGYALRYVFAGADGTGTSSDPSDYWDLSRVVSPGYTIGEYGEDENRWNAEKIWEPWLQVDLPALQLRLRDDITASDPTFGEKLYIVDTSDAPSTQGLDDSGDLFIGNELIHYLSKTADAVVLDHQTNPRGAGGTTATAHAEGDTIQVKDSETGLATTAPKVNEITWSRPAGAIYPTAFDLYTTVNPRKRHPGDAEWSDDWTLRVAVADYAPDPVPTSGMHTWSHTLSPARRVESLLFAFTEMSEDPYRPRINEVSAGLDDAAYQAESWLNAGESVGQVIQAMLTGAGVPADAITLEAGTLAPTGYTVETGYAWATAADLADYASAQIEVDLLSQITIRNNDFWTAVSLAADYTWSRADIKSVAITQRPITPLRQLKIAYVTPSNQEEQTVVYPASADMPADGEIQSIGKQVFADASDATQAATRRYYYTRYPYTAVVEMAYPGKPGADNPQPGEFIQINWDFGPDEHATARYSRVHLIESVDVFVDSDLQPAVTLALTQIGRSSYE